MRRVLIIPLALLFFVSFAHVNPVQACTGGGSIDFTVIEALFSRYSTIVAGRIHTVSDRAFNAVLHVEQVIKGDPINEYIVFSRHPPDLIAFAATGRAHPFQCFNMGIRRPSGKRFIAGLWSASFGTYDGTIITEDQNGMFAVTNPSNLEVTALTYDEMIVYAARQLNERPRPSQKGNVPRPAAVRLSTQAGTSYMLPIDHNKPIAVKSGSEAECLTYETNPCIEHIKAPNGYDTVTMYPLSVDISGYQPQMGTRTKAFINGETGVHSARSDLFAVWAGHNLNAYAAPNQTSLSNSVTGYDGLLFLRTLTIEPDDALIPGAGAWSPDGRTFAFSTESGVWLWDILQTDPSPRQLQFTSGEPMLVRHFSPDGNFLNIEVSSHRYNLDINTLQEYPDGLFSPDDRLLAVFDTTATEPTPLKIYGLFPEFAPHYKNSSYTFTTSQFEWVDERTYVSASCGEPIPNATVARLDEPWCEIIFHTIGWDTWRWMDGIVLEGMDGVLFDYDPVTRSLVTLIDGDTITFNGEVLEIGGIDSAIVGVELIPVIDLDYTKF